MACLDISLRVLVVDDERNIADTLAPIHQTRGHRVRTAYSGDAAVLIALNFQPNAVVSDVVMPGMSGLDLADWFAEHCPE
jgi:DNA-binding response OmpR family regulator